MLAKFLGHLRQQWMGALALFLVLTSGVAYAANTVFSEDIVDGEVKSADLANNAVRSPKIGTGQVLTQDLGAGAVDGSKIADGAVDSPKVINESLTNSDLATNSVQDTEIADASIDGGEVIDNSLTGSEITNGSLTGSDISDNNLSSADLASSSVGASEVANNSLTAFDLAGGESNGAINLGAGYVASGRCRDADASVPGTHTGDVVLFSINGSVPAGVLVYGVRVPSDGTLTVKVCNFTGGAFPAISNLPIAAVSISI